MEAYKNISGSSGVMAYEIGTDFIKIRFQKENFVYLYNYQIPGIMHVEAMKKKARDGAGLATYISKFVKDAYFSKTYFS